MRSRSLGAAALLSVADTLKPEAREVVAAMRGEGLRVVMLTGDNRRAAEAIGKQAGVDQVVAEVRPEEKASRVKALQADGKKVVSTIPVSSSKVKNSMGSPCLVVTTLPVISQPARRTRRPR